MVRHNKRHSRKKGGKRSRGRRQSGGMWRMTEGWKSLITSDDNVVHDTTTTSTFPPTLEKGIDIKYRVSPSGKPEWLIGGKEHTVGELFRGAKDGRYKDVIEEVRKSGIDLPDDQNGIILTNEQFCKLFRQHRHGHLLPEQKMQRPLAYKYKNVTLAVVDKFGEEVCDDRPTLHNLPMLHMHKAQRPPRASSAYAGPSAAPPPHPPPPDNIYMGDSHVSEGIDAQRRRFHSNVAE